MKAKMIINPDVDLKWMIIDKGYSVSGFAKKVGITRNYIYRILNKERCPSVQLAARIERKLDAKHHSIFSVGYVSKRTQSTA